MEWKGKNPGPLVVLCHGLFGFVEKPVMRGTAGELVMAGYTVVRFNATNGASESRNSFIDFTVGGYIQDTKQIISHVLRILGKKEYSIIGFSIGAMPAYIIASSDKRMKCMVLQGPTYDLKYEQEREKMFSILKRRGWVNMYSYGLKKNIKVGILLYHEGIRYKVDQYLKKVICPTLVIYGSNEYSGTQKKFIELYRQLRCKKKRIILPNMPHTLISKKHINLFARETIKWLDKNI